MSPLQISLRVTTRYITVVRLSLGLYLYIDPLNRYRDMILREVRKNNPPEFIIKRKKKLKM